MPVSPKSLTANGEIFLEAIISGVSGTFKIAPAYCMSCICIWALPSLAKIAGLMAGAVAAAAWSDKTDRQETCAWALPTNDNKSPPAVKNLSA
ncbi:hypothetical protein D3C87_1470370 [compost metagenome]